MAEIKVVMTCLTETAISTYPPIHNSWTFWDAATFVLWCQDRNWILGSKPCLSISGLNEKEKDK